jgi:hypothetical protein
VRAAPPEIQETGKGFGAAQPPEIEDGDARTLDLAHFSWAATFEAGDDVEEDEESAACNTLECGLSLARCVFDELILPATMVSSLDATIHL